MSASLVGSEMCIRDSGLPAQPHPVPPLGQPARGRGAHAPPIQTSQRTVSYTHLTLPTICSV
eukprot:4120698-Alexandrium_andersonii.AAC.1